MNAESDLFLPKGALQLWGPAPFLRHSKAQRHLSLSIRAQRLSSSFRHLPLRMQHHDYKPQLKQAEPG